MQAGYTVRGTSNLYLEAIGSAADTNRDTNLASLVRAGLNYSSTPSLNSSYVANDHEPARTQASVSRMRYPGKPPQCRGGFSLPSIPGLYARLSTAGAHPSGV
jgi:hypothetical protein